MRTIELRLPDGAVYVTQDQEAKPVTKSAVTAADERKLGAAVIREAVAKDRLIEALEAEASKLEKEAIDLGPGHRDIKEIKKAKAAEHRSRIRVLKGD